MTPLPTFLANTRFIVETGADGRTLLPTLHGDTLRAATADGVVWVEFAVAVRARYTTLTIRDWQGITDRPGTSLHVSVPLASRLYLTELDYMTTWSRRKDVRRLEWLSPAKHFGVNPPGAFAVFVADTDDEHDETLLHIWVDENQPHPMTGREWNLTHARRWLADWQQTFGRRSQMVVNAASLQELYDLVPYAEKAAIDEIYIFTNTWRPDPFWPMTDVNWALNKQVFPSGRADLRAYSDHLAKRGIRLALHYVSGGIGLYDPVYVGSHPHPGLASWGAGRLRADINEQQTVLPVTPGEGMAWPFVRPTGQRHPLPHLEQPAWLNHLVIQVGDELIKCRAAVADAAGGWSLTGCERGLYRSTVAAHRQNATVKFLVVPYGQNFVPDNNHELLYEIADHYASLLNDCRIAHAEFDGAEIHCYDGHYGYIKFAQRIYEQVDHGISGHDSGASAPRCFFEYRFKSTQRVLRGACGFTHGNWLVPFQIDSASRPSSTLLDAHFFLSQGHWGGALGISKPEPMFGVTTAMLATHGLTDRFLEALHDWNTACGLLTDEQHQLIEDSLRPPAWPMPEASDHRVADTVYTLERRADAGYDLVPVRVMTREQGDIQWQLGQEYGPVSPRQFVRLGEPVELLNPFAAQPPAFIIRVLPAFDHSAPTVPAASLAAQAEKIFDDKDFFVEGNTPAGSRASRRAVLENVDLMPAGFDGVLRASNDQPDAVYHVRDLPAYPLRVDLSAHRGLGIELEGDGSGALVLVQWEGKGGRDYVVPIDFNGPRYVEIPCGEVSWTRADWGWRMGIKTMDYAQVAQCRIGLGMVPARSDVSIRIRQLTALVEKVVPLVNPTIRINDTCLQIEGTVTTGHYLVGTSRSTVEVYDPNWHQVEELRVSFNNLHARAGVNTVTVEASAPGICPWLEVQLLVKDIPVGVGQATAPAAATA